MATALEQAAEGAAATVVQDTGATNPGSSQSTTNGETGAATTQPANTTGDQGDAASTTGATDSTKTDAKTDGGGDGVDWAGLREKAAGGDEKILKRLARYGTVEEALRAGVEAQNRLNSTKSLVRPDDKSTPEEIKAYREANGVPETLDGYKIELPDGVVLGDQDKPEVDDFLRIAHEHHLPPKTVNALVSWKVEMQQRAYEAQAQADETARAEGTQELTQAWGQESAANVNLVSTMLNEALPGVKDNLLGARLADGTLLANSPDVLKFLASTARALNPLATFGSVPGSTTMTDIDTRIGELSKLAGNRNSEYWKGPTAASLQKELLDLNKRKSLLSAKK